MTAPDDQALGPALLIRARRRQAQLTQQQLAARLGVSARQVIRWEHGESTPSEEVRPRLAEVLGGRPDDYGSARAAELAREAGILGNAFERQFRALTRSRPGARYLISPDVGDAVPDELVAGLLAERTENQRQRNRIRRLEARVEQLETTIAALYNELLALRLTANPLQPPTE